MDGGERHLLSWTQRARLCLLAFIPGGGRSDRSDGVNRN